MQKSLVLGLALGVLALSPASAADLGDDAVFGVTVNPVSLLLGAVDGSAEMKLPLPKVTAKANLFWSPNLLWVSNMSGLDLQVTGRYYYGSLPFSGLDGPWAFLKKGPLQGAYAGAGMSIHTWGWKYYGTELSYFTPGLVMETGFKYFGDEWNWWPRGFYAEAGLQFDLVFNTKWTYKSGGADWTGSSAPYARGGLSILTSIGYAF